MKKISTVFVLFAGFLITGFFLGQGGANADNQTMTDNGTQVLNDEGYGKDDVEYYNSEDDAVNDEGPVSQINSSANGQ